MPTTVNVNNASRYARTDWLLYGQPLPTPTSVVIPGNSGYYNIGRATVPGQFTGEVTLDELDPALPFTLHPAVLAQMMSGGFHPYLEINGRPIELVPKAALLLNDRRLIVSQWTGRTQNGTVQLIVYLFTDHAIAQFELGIFGESLTSPSSYIGARFMLGTGTKAVTWVYDHDRLDPAGNPIIGEPIKALKMPSGPTGDAQGFIWRGLVAFYRGDESQAERESIVAAMTHPLFGIAKWPTWGTWNKETAPVGDPADDSAQLAAVNWSDPLAHPRLIQNARPADSGEQAEFAVPWSHFADVTRSTAQNLWRKLCAAYRESCRPIHYYEPNGDPVKASAHPAWVVWSEETHWHTGVSRDRLGRTHAGSNANGWFGHDDQHQAWIFACENHKLTGSFMLSHMIGAVQENWIAALTVPSTHPGWATNDPSYGRAVGHFARAIGLSLRVKWNQQLFFQHCKRILESIYPFWVAQRQAGPISSYTLIFNDPRTGFPNQAAWAPWQDSIFVMGMDTFLRCTEQALSGEVRNKLLTMIEEVGRSVCEYGYTPDGGQAVAYMPIPGGQPPANYSDPTQCTLATGTDWRHWDLSCVGITEERLHLPRATQLRQIHEPSSRPQYNGTLLP